MGPPHNRNRIILSRLIIAACLLVLLAPLSCAKADWINLTGAEISPNIAEIYVEDDRVRLVLEIYIGDIAAVRRHNPVAPNPSPPTRPAFMQPQTTS